MLRGQIYVDLRKQLLKDTRPILTRLTGGDIFTAALNLRCEHMRWFLLDSILSNLEPMYKFLCSFP